MLFFSIPLLAPLARAADDADKSKGDADEVWNLIEKEQNDPIHSDKWRDLLFKDPGGCGQWLKEIERKETEWSSKGHDVLVSTGLPPSQGIVSHVTDGDTIKVEGVGEIRVAGVDTPEEFHPYKPVGYWAEEAKQFTAKLALGDTVQLEFGDEIRDVFDRVIAVIHLSDGRVLNEEIVKEGMGIAFTRYPFQHEEKYLQFMEQARAQGKGIWGDRGMAEVAWMRVNEKEDQFIEVPMNYERWYVKFRNLILVGLTKDQKFLEEKWLRRDIYMLGPKDLEAELKKRCYREDAGSKGPAIN